MTEILNQVFAIIEDRKANPKQGSYTTRLFDEGEDEIVKKIGEEAVEVILAAKGQGDDRVISELADLTYHCLVLLAQRGLTPGDVAAELERATTTLRPGVCQADAKTLPFPSDYFDRVLMFDVVEHLFPWELQQALVDIGRVLKPGGRLVIHTAPNRWYDTYAYPWVRRVRTLLGDGDGYPKDPRAITPE